MKKTVLALLSLSVIFASPAVSSAQVNTGDPAPDFTLTDTTGTEHTLSGSQGKYVVLEWINHDCPFVKKHYESGNMQELQEELTGKDAVWYSIASSAEGKQGHLSPEEWNELSGEKGSKATAVLLDPDGQVGKAYGAQTTPHMFVIDPNGKVIYQGAIDSVSSTDPSDIPEATNYVRQAFDESSSGSEVSNPSTKAYGCSVKY